MKDGRTISKKGFKRKHNESKSESSQKGNLILKLKLPPSDAPSASDLSKSVEVPVKRKKKKKKEKKKEENKMCGACGKVFSDFDSLLSHTNECDSVKKQESSATQSEGNSTKQSSNEIKLDWSCPPPQSQVPSATNAPTSIDVSKGVEEPDRKKKKKKKYEETCGACGKGFSDFDSLVSHASECDSVRNKETKETQSEVKPTEKSNDELNLEWSCPPPHRSQTNSCPKCNKKFSKAKRLAKHLKKCEKTSDNDNDESRDEDVPVSVLQKPQKVKGGTDSVVQQKAESVQDATNQQQANSATTAAAPSGPQMQAENISVGDIDRPVTPSTQASDPGTSQSSSLEGTVERINRLNTQFDSVKVLDDRQGNQLSSVYEKEETDTRMSDSQHIKDLYSTCITEEASMSAMTDMQRDRPLQGGEGLSSLPAKIEDTCEEEDLPATTLQSVGDIPKDFAVASTPKTLSTQIEGVDSEVQHKEDLSSDVGDKNVHEGGRASPIERGKSQTFVDHKPATLLQDLNFPSAAMDDQKAVSSLPEQLQTAPEAQWTTSNQGGAFVDQSQGHLSRDQIVSPITEKQETSGNDDELSGSPEPKPRSNLSITGKVATEQDEQARTSYVTCEPANLVRSPSKHSSSDATSKESPPTILCAQQNPMSPAAVDMTGSTAKEHNSPCAHHQVVDQQIPDVVLDTQSNIAKNSSKHGHINRKL